MRGHEHCKRNGCRIWLTQLLVLCAGGTDALAARQPEDLLALSLEQLADIPVSGVGSLTETRWHHLPASVTRISASDIAASGARSLDELLEIFVPGLQVWNKTNADQIGMRGVISDRNTKYLLLVNGRQMNEDTSLGAFSERFLSLLGDIDHINVIRGAGSSIYGPGAIAGIISIETLEGRNVEHTRIQVRAGALEEFIAAEYNTAHRFSHGGELLFYYGIDDYRGADSDDATLQFSQPLTNVATATTVPAYSPIPFGTTDYHGAHRDQPRHKLHLDYRQGDWRSWLRYTKGGQSRDLSDNSFANLSPAQLAAESYGYQQLTWSGEHLLHFSGDLLIETRLGYDLLDLEYGERNYREDEVNLRSLLHWQPAAGHQLAAGIELNREYLGKESLGYPGGDANITTALTALDSGSWVTNSLGLLAEYQWQLAPDWILFAGGRADQHTYTEWLYSPRLALVFSASQQDQLKLMLNRSVRRAEEETLRESYLTSRDRDGRHEQLDALELSWERQGPRQSRFLASLFWNDYDLIAWDSSAGAINEIGNLKTLGVELEAHSQWQRHRISALYSFVQEQDFTLADSDVTQFISASVYGYGDDLANWAQHSLKLIHQYAFDEQWSSFASLRSFWDLDGTEAMADYNRIEHSNAISILPRTDGRNEAFESRHYLNLGLSWQERSTTLRLQAYNVLGWHDKELNRRNTFSRAGQYRTEAAALALSWTQDF